MAKIPAWHQAGILRKIKKNIYKKESAKLTNSTIRIILRNYEIRGSNHSYSPKTQSCL